MVLVAFAVGVAGGKHRVIDVFWGLGFAVVGLTGLVLSAGRGNDVRRWLVAALTTVWGLRLSSYVAWRGRGEPEHRRYDRMLARAPGNRTSLRFVRYTPYRCGSSRFQCRSPSTTLITSPP